MEIAVLIILGLGLYWFFILRPGRLDFWRLAAKYRDAAYDHFRANPCWKVFEDGLPGDYRNVVPKPDWVEPFRLFVPKLGGKMIRVFARHPDFERSQEHFLAKFGRGTWGPRTRGPMGGHSGKEVLSLLLNTAGHKLYRELVQHHIRRQSTSRLQQGVLGEASLLPDELQPFVIEYIDTTNARFMPDQDFWRGATCQQAFEKIIETAIDFLPIRDTIPDIQAALRPENQELAFQLFQIPTLSFAYSASTQKVQRKFMGIRRGVFR